MSQQRAPVASEDLYETLQVSARADAEVIEAAYRVLARRYHPDRNRAPGATARMAQINGAWEILRRPERRAAYDRERARIAVQSQPATAQPAHNAPGAEHTPSADTAPQLFADPARLAVGPLARGTRRELMVDVATDPPGIRVECATADDWLDVRPTVLRGLEKERITVQVRTMRLRPGIHHSGVELATSWERRLLPVEVQVRSAPLLARAVSLLRYGPAGDRETGSTVAVALAITALCAIALVLLLLAVGK